MAERVRARRLSADVDDLWADFERGHDGDGTVDGHDD
jgi:hypothetical protein